MKWFSTLLLVTALGAAGPLSAQDSDAWDWKVVPYLWGVNMDGTLAVGPLSSDLDVSFSDILSDMDIGGSIVLQAGKGAHGFHFDYTYLRIKPDAQELNSPPFPAGSNIASKLTVNILEAGYNWRITQNQALIFGVRYNDMEMRLTPTLTGPGPIDPDPREAGPSWTDGFLGFRSSHEISQNWDFTFYGTVGAGDSDFPWTAQATFARRFSNDNRLHLGFRVWGIDYSENNNILERRASLDVTIYGFLVGYEFN